MELAALTGNQKFADDFFDKYVEGHDVVDYARLLKLAGYELRKTNAGKGWAGNVQVQPVSGGLKGLQPIGMGAGQHQHARRARLRPHGWGQPPARVWAPGR